MEEFFIRHNTELKDLLRYGVLRAEELKNPSLYDGKLGMAIIFYEYSRYSNDVLYEEFADELINSVLEVPKELSYSLGKGLIGLGWGIAYLLREKFIDGDIENIFGEIEKYLTKRIKYNQKLCEDYSMYIELKEKLIGSQGQFLNVFSNEHEILERIWYSCIYE